MIMECIELNWYSDHMKKIRISQASKASISRISCNESSKTVFAVSIVKRQKNCLVLIYDTVDYCIDE